MHGRQGMVVGGRHVGGVRYGRSLHRRRPAHIGHPLGAGHAEIVAVAENSIVGLESARREGA